jgi:hypothetical protein
MKEMHLKLSSYPNRFVQASLRATMFQTSGNLILGKIQMNEIFKLEQFCRKSRYQIILKRKPFQIFQV